MTGGCAVCAQGAECYFHVKRRSGLFRVRDPQLNGYRTKLTSDEWRFVGVDLSWPPPPEPNAAPAERWLPNADTWEPTDREASFLARELTWLSRIGSEDLDV